MVNQQTLDYEILKTHQQERDIIEAMLQGENVRGNRNLREMSFGRRLKLKITLFFCGKSKLYSSLFEDVKDYCEIPVPFNAINSSNYDNCSKCVRKIIDLKEKVSKAKGRNEGIALYRELADKKMELFYEISIKGEANYFRHYLPFKKQLQSAREKGDWNLLRVDNNSCLSEYKNKFKEASADDLWQLMYEYNSIRTRDVTNLIGNPSVNKLSKQAEDLSNVYERICQARKDLKDKAGKLNDILMFVRLCAYRNIYLGVELVNCFYLIKAGKSLTTNKESIKLPESEIPTVEYKKIPSWGLNDVLKSIDFGEGFSECIDSIGKFAKWVSNDKETLKLARANKKEAAVITLGVGLFSMVSEWAEQIKKARNKKIRDLGKYQRVLIRKIDKEATAYNSSIAPISRGIEIIKAITKANEGFMKIYSQLREKVFENGDVSSVTVKDIQQITKATNEYNKIATSRL